MIIFDFDGVIGDTRALCLEACNSAARNQGLEQDLPFDAFAALDPLTFEALAETYELKPDKFAQDVAKHVATHIGKAAPFAGMREALAEIEDIAPLAVVSASQSSVLRRFLSDHDLLPCFSDVIGGDQPGQKPEKVGALLKGCTETVHAMVGDAASDMFAAKHNNIAAVGVSWGWQSADRLRTAGATYVVSTPADLTICLQNLIKG